MKQQSRFSAARGIDEIAAFDLVLTGSAMATVATLQPTAAWSRMAVNLTRRRGIAPLESAPGRYVDER
jgi:hypothetical protein